MKLIADKAITTDKRTFILPEISFGCLEPVMIEHWKKFLAENTKIKYVIASAYICKSPMENTSILITTKDVEVIYKQRMPMIYGMYNPFSSNSFKGSFFGKSTYLINNINYGFLICYESVLQWAYYQPLLQGADIFISQNSIPWDKTVQIKLIQKQMLEANSRLFNKKYIDVWND